MAQRALTWKELAKAMTLLPFLSLPSDDREEEGELSADVESPPPGAIAIAAMAIFFTLKRIVGRT